MEYQTEKKEDKDAKQFSLGNTDRNEGQKNDGQ